VYAKKYEESTCPTLLEIIGQRRKNRNQGEMLTKTDARMGNLHLLV